MPVRFPTRRELLRAGMSMAGYAAAHAAAPIPAWLQSPACVSSGARGDLLGLVPFAGDPRRETPLGQLLDAGLDARLFTDLSTLEPDRVITPSDRVFIRTTAPPLQDSAVPWTIRVVADSPRSITVDQLVREARPMGAHLIECSGNNDPQNFGLMSVAEWDGVPLTSVLPQTTRWGVLVRGVDHAGPSRSSVPGASWVLPRDAAHTAAPFLAVRMNGRPLTPDHGAPVRLVVPGWYGCSWIKWVDELRLVDRDEPATSQMREFAARTHQDGVPTLARDYAPPAIDTAAMPIRVEKRRVDGRLVYRIVGIVWGGERPVDRLLIRFGPTDPPRPVAVCPPPSTHLTWSLWDFWWQPETPGFYSVGLRVADPSVRTRRLDISFYVRRVRIDDV